MRKQALLSQMGHHGDDAKRVTNLTKQSAQDYCAFRTNQTQDFCAF